MQHIDFYKTHYKKEHITYKNALGIDSMWRHSISYENKSSTKVDTESTNILKNAIKSSETSENTKVDTEKSNILKNALNIKSSENKSNILKNTFKSSETSKNKRIKSHKKIDSNKYYCSSEIYNSPDSKELPLPNFDEDFFF